MSRLLSIAIGAALGFAASVPLYAADVQSTSNATTQTAAMSDSQANAALEKCRGMTGTEGARCVVNIRPAGGGGSSRAVSVDVDDENAAVKTGLFTDDEYAAAVKHCDAGKPKNRERCIANVRDSFGRM
jgi:hypothetical protein